MQVFYGDIVTCDRQGNVCKYLVEDEGEIIFVGNELPDYYPESIRTLNMGSKALLPSFGDGHIHFSNWSFFNGTYDVRSATSIEEILQIVRAYAERDERAKVLFGFGLSENSLVEKRLITRSELDAAIKDRPVFLVGYDGHSAVANTAAIGMFPRQIRSLRGFNLETGHLFHEAFLAASDYITGKVPPLQLARYMAKGVDALAGYGVGLVHAVEGIGFPRDLDVDLVRFMARSAGIQFRIYFQTLEVGKVLKRKLPRVGGCFACALDGSFGSKDAATLEPYLGDRENRGILFYRDEVVFGFVKEANRAGLQVQLHCIGDAAVVQAVKAIEAALEDYPRLDHRHTLIHACLIPEATLEVIAKLGIGITLQPGFLISPLEPPQYMESLIGERAAQIWPLKKFLDMGIHINGGSDGPVTIPNPLEGINGACNHIVPEQSLTVADALRVYTHNVAFTSFDENERGSLEKGKIADMVVLNKNPLQLAPADLGQLKVDYLYQGGKLYRPGKKLPALIMESLKNLRKPV
jgi:predicted amidohydrolase YtcJ